MAETELIHRARWVVCDPDTVIPEGYVRTRGGIIREIGSGRGGMKTVPVVDHGSSILLPALINSHTHLELGALRGKVDFRSGFKIWVARLLQQREAAGEERLIAGADEAAQELKASGTGAVGEISTLGLTLEILSESGLFGVWFREYLGSGEMAESDALGRRGNLIFSLAGHGPHTTSPDFLIALKKAAAARNLPFSLHLAESDDEIRFLTTGKGEWADFLQFRGIDFSGWGLPAHDPVSYADSLGILDERTLLVHLLWAGKKEFDLLKKRKARVCLCPRSNLNLHGRLPDIPGMIRARLFPCLGTDSPASVETLSLFHEMAFISAHFPDLRPETIFAMATRNGADALGLDACMGTLSPGKMAIFALCRCSESLSPSRVMETIVCNPSQTALVSDIGGIEPTGCRAKQAGIDGTERRA